MSKLFYNDDANGSKNLFESWSFNKTNYFLLFSGILLIILGYFIMAYGEVNSFQSLTLAPIILFFGYIILIPSALIYKKRNIKSLSILLTKTKIKKLSLFRPPLKEIIGIHIINILRNHICYQKIKVML